MKENAAHYHGRSARLERGLAVGAALVAGACWGVSFLAPRAVGDVDSATLAFFRFFYFGVSSWVALGFRALVPRAEPLPRLDRRTCARALVLAGTGYSVYYFILSLGVKGAGISFAVGIVGLLPLTILLATTSRARWRALAIPMTLILVGGILIAWDLFRNEREPRPFAERVGGLVASFAALGLWTYFAVANADFLRRARGWRSLDWASVLGVASLPISFAIFVAAAGAETGERLRAGFGHPTLWMWTAFMGIAGTWIATAFWNFASKHLAGAWLGQLLVFESVFGLLFGFFYDERWPTGVESVALVCLLAGVVLGLARLARTGGGEGAKSS